MKLSSLVSLAAAQRHTSLTENDCRTPNFCSRARRELCASDGKTYSDECAWKRSVCGGNDKAKTLVAFGSCNEFEAQCRNKLNKCVKRYKPVCGDNGITFGNSCAIDHHNCIPTNEPVKEAYQGECRAMSNDVTPCIQDCNNKYKPVCGSDGKTYRNKCFLENESCAEPALVIVAKGPCPEEAEEEEGGIDSRLAPIECPQFCNRMLAPVCASNYQTYANECVLRSDHCEKDERLTQLYEGPCKCPSLCPASVDLVCGSNGKTYTSPCHLARSRCGGGETKAVDVEFEHWGACELENGLEAELVISPEVNLKFGRPRNLDNKWRPRWAPEPAVPASREMLLDSVSVSNSSADEEAEEEYEPNTGCPCHRAFRPVCGANKRDYANECLAECDGQETWTEGNCAQMANDVFASQERNTETEEAEEYEPNTACPCHRAFRPVCGANNRDYANDCLAECDGQETWTEGNCPEMANDFVAQETSTEAKETEDEPNIMCPCHRAYRPVCGANGRDYTNECLAECDGQAEFTVGACAQERLDDFVEAFNQYEEEPEEEPEQKFCVCPRILNPVCAVSGKEYSNDCEANCQDDEIEFECSCDSVKNGKCAQMAGDLGLGFFGFPGWGYGAVLSDEESGGFANDFVEQMAEQEQDLESKCSRSCRGNPYDEKCGLINGQYKSYDNWCELDIALCMNPGKDVSYTEVCGMKRNGNFKIYSTGCVAELNNAAVVDMSLCDDAKTHTEKAPRRSNGVFQPWRFRLVGR